MPPTPPNILLILTEHHRGDWTAFNPAVPVRTPTIEHLGRDGVFFSQALCPSPLCVPSRVCLAAGREYDHCDVIDNQQCYPLHHETFYELLRREAGYHTMMCGKFDLVKPLHAFQRDGGRTFADHPALTRGWEPAAREWATSGDFMTRWGITDGIDNGGKYDGVGTYRKGKVGPYLDYLEGRGLAEAHVRDYRRRSWFSCRPCPLPDEAYCDNWIARQARALLERAPGDRPWFLQVNFNGAHNPWDITARMRADMDARDPRYPRPYKVPFFLRKRHNKVRQNYSAQVENIDQLVGDLLDYLASTDQLAHTLVAYSADHGEMLGDHNQAGKRFPWHASANVPLAIHGPGVRPRGVVAAPVESLDLVGTFLDYAGVPVPATMDARSLRAYLEGREDILPRETATSGFYGWRVAFDGRYKLVAGFAESRWKLRFGGRYFQSKRKKVAAEPVTLYDLQADPRETTDVAPDHPAVVERLLASLPRPPKPGQITWPKDPEGAVYGHCRGCGHVDRLVLHDGRFLCRACAQPTD